MHASAKTETSRGAVTPWRTYVGASYMFTYRLQIYVVYITKIKLIRYLCVVYVGMNGGVGKRPARLDLNLPMVPSDAVIVREVA